MENRKLEKQMNHLKQLREETGMNRRQFADFFCIPLRTVEDWEAGKRNMPEYLMRLIAYKVKLECIDAVSMQSGRFLEKGRNINIINDENGNSIVIINDIRFKGKQHINWEEVEVYIKEYVGCCYEIIETSDKIYIGSDFPMEFKGSIDTTRLKGANAKAKANAAQEIPLLIENATNKRWNDNYKIKHNIDAKYGWYRYTSRFALPIYTNDGELERYNIFRIEMLVRHASDDKLYLYDMVNVKKEKETEYPA